MSLENLHVQGALPLPRFNYYPATIKSTRPIGTVDIMQFFHAIQSPKPHIRQVFDDIQRAEMDGDMALKAKLKATLFYFTPSVLVTDRRAYANIKSFTGLMPLDFDHLTPQEAIELKDHLFNDFDFVIASWLSASRCGVRCLVNIPIVTTIAQYKAYFLGLMHHCDMGLYKGFDIAPQNCVLPLFLSYDPTINFGDTVGIWDTPYIAPVSLPPRQYKYNPNAGEVERRITAIIGKITSNGHPQLRSAAYLLGGYVSAGYMDTVTAVDLINDLIITNQYLSQKPDVYKVTAKTMIEKGLEKPCYL